MNPIRNFSAPANISNGTTFNKLSEEKLSEKAQNFQKKPKKHNDEPENSEVVKHVKEAQRGFSLGFEQHRQLLYSAARHLITGNVEMRAEMNSLASF